MPMLFKRIESEGLAHYSYIVGDRHEAVVIDPRRDCELYIDETLRGGRQITTILETHRNEDYLIGSRELAGRTGAEIWHADPQLGYRYGNSTKDGQEWKIGRLKLKAISTPGHTPGHFSYLLNDFDGAPWMVFTGDALFSGDVGRVDLAGPERIAEMASNLYDSLFNRLLPLGDQVLVCPAHGAGSVCAASIADRVWTSIGIERLRNPKLQFSGRQDFIRNAGRQLEAPPYFRKMEELNLEPPLMHTLPVPRSFAPAEFARRMQDGIVLDTRLELGFGSSHVPGSISIWIDGVPSFAGWFLPYDKPIYLVNEQEDPEQVVRMLIRMGYDNIAGFLSGNMLSWNMAGCRADSIKMISVESLCHDLDTRGDTRILDVRGEDEIKKEGRIPGAQNIHVTQIPRRLEEVSRGGEIKIFCGSGLRSMIAASFLKKNGWQDLAVVLGGFAGWKSDRCPIEKSP